MLMITSISKGVNSRN